MSPLPLSGHFECLHLPLGGHFANVSSPPWRPFCVCLHHPLGGHFAPTFPRSLSHFVPLCGGGVCVGGAPQPVQSGGRAPTMYTGKKRPPPPTSPQDGRRATGGRGGARRWPPAPAVRSESRWPPGPMAGLKMAASAGVGLQARWRPPPGVEMAPGRDGRCGTRWPLATTSIGVKMAAGPGTCQGQDGRRL